MHSCEYLGVPKANEKQTRLLDIHNIQFLKNNTLMNRNSENVTHADYIAIMFESQKNEEKLQMIVQHIPNQILYPVKALGLLVQSILSNENTSENTQVNYYQSDSGPMPIQATDMLVHFRATCRTLDERRLGFHPNKVGTHSIRTSFAM